MSAVGASESDWVDIEIEPVIGKKGDYIAHLLPPADLIIDEPGNPQVPQR